MYQPAEFSTTLSASASISATSLSVASATGLPTLGSGDVTVIRLDDGNAPAENVLVTAISGTTLTCAALANAHSSGASVKGSILNIAALTQIRKDSFAMGPEVAVTSSVTVTLGKMHRCSPTSADITLTIPNGTVEGDVFAVRVAQAATKFVTLSATANIDGASTRMMWKSESAYLRWDSANSTWTKVAGRTVPMSATISLTGASTMPDTAVTTVALDTSTVDNTGLMVETANHGLRIKRAGVYGGNAVFGLLNVSTSIVRMIVFIKNGSTTIAANEGGGYFATSNPGLTVPMNIVAAQGDLITIQGFHLNSPDPGATETVAAGAGAPVTALSVVELPNW